MDIKGLDYNTQRDRLQMPEYGREIKNMVNHCLTITDREERLHCAETIVDTMCHMTPQEGRSADRMQELWDHLAIMSDFKLDIDYPVDITQAHNISQRPKPIGYSQRQPHVRHYGNIMAGIFEKLKTMPAGKERDALAALTANKMKLCLTEWSNGSNDNEKVADDLARLTDGVIQLDLDTFHFAPLPANNEGRENNKKKKKK